MRPGGLPPQSALMTGRAVFTEAYAVIPRTCQSDIVTSYLPGWQGMRMWVLARPLSGFAETFSQYLVELAPGGGSPTPEEDRAAQSVIYVTEGALDLTLDGATHRLEAGGYAYVAAGADWSLHSVEGALFHWVRKRWTPAAGVTPPASFVTTEAQATTVAMPDTEGRWATTRFVSPEDTAHDFHVNVVTFQPGGTIPFEETHVMEHGLFVLEGKAVYKLNRDWVEVEAGDFMWLRAFCPQACYAGGPGPFRYLLYKDVNRHARLSAGI
ncbi:bifunctional allantoicase/(S)-ureidoglycine aminohydrolase [Jannaschia sp. M317]|uniref:bifunctional allantoicase/(S)-ureidoglycine aminohydrolase n=1 Tax=Jannaschia sp. M317 TaxID=2867011 RepID=UPI0021A4A6BD|nr:bifunctional allantoicase/(S)-ureidoglycine aminohydrolase [Jannaschia sp. M317]UWQ17962.1 (S)-ureidoglycine aminohydrolase [Jannaschia sp. M317]